ncbi:hypothetical protein ACFX2I_022261 [Malus domestica]
MLESIDRVVGKARYELTAAGENVSAWKVVQSTLLMLKVDSWDSLGFQMQQVPSLNLLMLTEAKRVALPMLLNTVEKMDDSGGSNMDPGIYRDELRLLVVFVVVEVGSGDLTGAVESLGNGV